MTKIIIKFSDTDKLMDEIREFLEDMKQDIMNIAANQLLGLIQTEITEGDFDTVSNKTVMGLVDMGEYRASWRTQEVGSGKDYKVQVLSVDAKAVAVEYGTDAAEQQGLTFNEIWDWAKRKGISHLQATRTYKLIKTHGTVAKPAVRRSHSVLKTQKDIIASKVATLYK